MGWVIEWIEGRDAGSIHELTFVVDIRLHAIFDHLLESFGIKMGIFRFQVPGGQIAVLDIGWTNLFQLLPHLLFDVLWQR